MNLSCTKCMIIIDDSAQFVRKLCTRLPAYFKGKGSSLVKICYHKHSRQHPQPSFRLKLPADYDIAHVLQVISPSTSQSIFVQNLNGINGIDGTGSLSVFLSVKHPIMSTAC